MKSNYFYLVQKFSERFLFCNGKFGGGGGGEGGIGQYPSYQNTSCPTSIDEDQPKNEIKVVRHYDGSQLKIINGYTQ